MYAYYKGFVTDNPVNLLCFGVKTLIITDVKYNAMHNLI